MSPMQKLNAKTDGTTVNIVEENIERLGELFPDASTESSIEGEPRFKVDFEALREILGDYVEDHQERYSTAILDPPVKTLFVLRRGDRSPRRRMG